MILLFIEDILFLSKIKTQARALGIQTVVADKANENVRELFLAQSYRKIFVDLNIQKRDPFALIRLLKADSVAMSIPIIAFFSHVQTELAQKASEAGCDSVMPRSQFSAHLNDLLAGV
ncbi:MAG TPA: hypothetical protein PL129_02755 [bacterium]|nr:hypothetical protein [bacterium]